MTSSLYLGALRLCAALLLGAAAASSFAVPVMDMHIEDLIAMGPDLKQSLNLNANQQRLWQQVDAKTHQLMRERLGRRDRLQAALKAGLAGPNVELRGLVGGLDVETAASAAEEKQLRELWLTVNDALNETQRSAAATFFVEQMQRVLDGVSQHTTEHSKDAVSRPHTGRPGAGGMGMPGS